MPRIPIRKTLLCSIVTLACASVYASEVFELGQIEVIGKASDVTTVVIEQQQFEQNQINNVAQTAKLTSGVFFERKGGRGEQNLLVRGFDSRRVPLYIDGIPVYVPYDGTMDLSRFNVFDLSQVVITKGGSSVLYGPNALGGAINLVTQKPSEAFEGTVGYGLQGGRSSDTLTNRAYFNLGSKQALFYVQLSGVFLERQGLQLSKNYRANTFNHDEDGGRADNSESRDKKLGLKLAYTPNSQDEYALTLSSQRGKKDQPFYAGNSAYVTPKYWIWPTWNKDSLYFLSHTEFGNGMFYLNSKLFFDTFKNDLSAYDDQTVSIQKAGSSFNSHYRDYSYGGGVEFGSHLSEKNTLKLTALYKFDLHKEHNDGEPTARSKDRTYSVAVENIYRFTEHTKLTAGVGFDRREALQSQNYQSDVKGLYHYDVADKNALNYQIKLNHRFDDNNELSVGFARKTRFPTMKDRYSRSINRYRTPNPFLKPERADHYEIAYFRTIADKVRLESTVFYSRVKEAINEVRTGHSKTITRRGVAQTVYETMNQNLGTEIYKGVELGITALISDKFTLGANYTYLRAKHKDNATIIKDVPRHKVFAYADWKITPALSFYISQSAESGRYSDDGKNDVKLPGFSITDIKLTYALTRHFALDVGISNLFDRNYYYAEGYPEEGRVYFSNLTYRF